MMNFKDKMTFFSFQKEYLRTKNFKLSLYVQKIEIAHNSYDINYHIFSLSKQ